MKCNVFSQNLITLLLTLKNKNMKANLLFLFIATFTLFSCNSNEQVVQEEMVIEEIETTNEVQILEPVSWEYTTEKIADNEFKITFNAQIDEHWYVYSSNIEGMGPIPTSINYEDSSVVATFGEIEENGAETKDGYDEMFDLNIKKFAKSATFSQTIKTTGPATITGYLEYMTCDSIQCLFPDPIEFSFEAN